MKKSILYRLSSLFMALIILSSNCSCSTDNAKDTKANQSSNFVNNIDTLKTSTENKQAFDVGKLDEEARTAALYLMSKGIEPIKFLAEKTKTYTASWEMLSKESEQQILNAFCDSAIQKHLEDKNYGSAVAKHFLFETSEVMVNEPEKHINTEVIVFDNKVMGAVKYVTSELSLENMLSLDGKTIEQFKNMDFLKWKGSADKTGVYEIVPKTAVQDGFNQINNIYYYGDSYLLIGCTDGQKLRLYKYDIQTAEDTYLGFEFSKENDINAFGPLKIKATGDGRMVLFLDDRLQIRNSKSFNVIQESIYPKYKSLFFDAEMTVDYSSIDISPDGKMLVYSAYQGIYLSDIMFKNPKLIVKAKLGKDSNGLDHEGPGGPEFSPDGKRIMYRWLGYEWYIGSGIINTDGSGDKRYTIDESEACFYRWYDNQCLFSSGPVYEGNISPMVLYADSGKKSALIDHKKSAETNWYLGDGKLYFDELKNGRLYFGEVDTKTNVEKQICDIPSVHLVSGGYVNRGQNFAFVAYNYPVKAKVLILAGVSEQ